MLRKYPRTRHLIGSRLQPGDHDLERVAFPAIACRPLAVEEKMDGANCAISFDADANLRLQSRGHFLTGGPRERHFDLFKQWAASIQDPLFDAISDRYVVYGEWLYAKHTIFYNALPSYFMEFDVLDQQTGEFLDTTRRTQLLCNTPITPVKVLSAGTVSQLDELTRLVGPSHFISADHIEKLRKTAMRYALDVDQIMSQTDVTGTMEGLYIKAEENGVVTERLKWVRNNFTTQIVSSDSHWLDRPIVPNGLLSNEEAKHV